MPRLSSYERNGALGMLACELTCREVVGRHDCSHQTVSSLAGTTTCSQQLIRATARHYILARLTHPHQSPVGQVSYYKSHNFVETREMEKMASL